MEIGVITLDGRPVGKVTIQLSGDTDSFVPNLSGYEPMGRAEHLSGGALGQGGGSHGGAHRGGHGGHHGGHVETPTDHRHNSIRYGHHKPQGKSYAPGPGGHPFSQGSKETDQAIAAAAHAHNLDPHTMRAIASIESSMNPSSNANRSTQYKGLYQIGHNEWDRFGNGGNIYSARENAMGAARMFDANRGAFRKKFGRNPTDTELYMMHQQGLGFYTRGAMTNIHGNPYPGMRGPQTHDTFEAGWGRELARRKAAFVAKEPKDVAKADPETEAP